MSWWHVDGLIYISAPAPTAWTRIDLSSVVGSARRLVMILVQDDNVGASASPIYRFRPAGAVAEWGDGTRTGPFGTTTLMTQSTGGADIQAGFVLLETDTVGAIEWICDGANDTSLFLFGWEDTYHHHGVTLASGVPPDPSAWTDLDLSPYIGTRELLTLCSVQAASVGGVFEYIALRPDTDLYTSDRRYEAVGGDHSAGCGVAKGRVAAAVLPLVVETDDHGQIEYYNSMSGAVVGSDHQIDLLGHIPDSTIVGIEYGPYAGVAVWTDINISGYTGNPRTLIALEVSHDDGVNPHEIAVQPEDLSVVMNIGGTGYSAGTAAAIVEPGRKVVLVTTTKLTGRFQWITNSGAGVDWTLRLIGHCAGGAVGVIGSDNYYPADEAIVAQDTEIRFRVHDDYGVDLTTLNVHIACVDQTIQLITGGAFTANATGVLIPITGVPGLTGYEVVIRPVADLDDRRWTPKVSVENFDGVALYDGPCKLFGETCISDSDCCTGTCTGGICLGIIG